MFCSVTADWKMQDVLEEEIKVINMAWWDVTNMLPVLYQEEWIPLLQLQLFTRQLKTGFTVFSLRYKEREHMMATFESHLDLPIICVDASDRFLSNLKGVKDLETKGKIRGGEFISTFDDFALVLEKKAREKTHIFGSGNSVSRYYRVMPTLWKWKVSLSHNQEPS